MSTRRESQSSIKGSKDRILKIRHLASNIKSLRNYKISIEQSKNDKMANMIKRIISKNLTEKKAKGDDIFMIKIYDDAHTKRHSNAKGSSSRHQVREQHGVRKALSPDPKFIYIAVKNSFFSKRNRIASPEVQIKKMNLFFKDQMPTLKKKPFSDADRYVRKLNYEEDEESEENEAKPFRERKDALQSMTKTYTNGYLNKKDLSPNTESSSVSREDTESAHESQLQNPKILRTRMNPNIKRIKIQEYGMNQKLHNPFIRKIISPSTFKKSSKLEKFHKSL